MNLEVGQFCSILLSSTPDIRLIIRGVAFWWECPSIRGTIVPHWKNSQVSAMGVKLHYQQHSNYVISRQVSLNDGENWSTRTSFKLTKLLSRDVYSTSLYDPKSYIGKTTYIWLCWLHLVLPSTCHSMLCCELEFAKLIYKG